MANLKLKQNVSLFCLNLKEGSYVDFENVEKLVNLTNTQYSLFCEAIEIKLIKETDPAWIQSIHW